MASADTPLMQQWRELKRRHADALLLFRVGDFYEMFNEDAEEGARLLDLTLTSRNNGSSRAPLAGVPAHSLDTYLERLVRLGRRVAICEQVEDPAEAKGIVRRAVTETVSPGAVFSERMLDARRNNFLAALAGNPQDPGATLGLAAADLSTGELTLRRVPLSALGDVLGSLDPAELILPRSWNGAVEIPGGMLQTRREEWLFDARSAADEILRHFGVLNLEGFGLGEADGSLIGACGALIAYLGEAQPHAPTRLRPPRVIGPGEFMLLDEMTRRNLELMDPLRGRAREGTLLGVLDEARTPMGGRLLRRRILAPLISPNPIQRRLSAVAELVDREAARAEVRGLLSEIHDLERVAIRVGMERANPRELHRLAISLGQVPELVASLANCEAPLLAEHRAALDPLDDLRTLLLLALDPETPATLADGGCIRAGYDPLLDELRSARDGAVDWIAQLQARERARTGIASLKVGFNKVFGYYIEVTRANLQRVPDDYQRKQTLANAERYFTPELKQWEEKVVGAEEQIARRETELFHQVRAQASAAVPRIQRLAAAVAAIDVLAALAEVAVRRDYCRPAVTDEFALEIRGGRHAVVETMMPREEFIPNDVALDEERRVLILTGPNMAGKSTVLRQVGLIVLLAQIGSFVPAHAAKIGVVDRIFTRVGASDNLVGGQSTFMVEMNETAAILHGATARSLVLLDEVGRGTSTWDGLSVATAVTEHLHDIVGAKTIFATHYHELTRLDERLPCLINFSVEVREEGDRILFLRRLTPGGADRSYGVEVARLAGLPTEVVERARKLLRELENGAGATDHKPRKSDAASATQLPLWDSLPHPVMQRLRKIDPNTCTPLEALNLLAELAELARA